MSRNIVPVDFSQLQEISGAFNAAFSQLLKQQVLDCQARPGVKSPPRKVNVQFLIHPEVSTYTDEDGRTQIELRKIELEVRMNASTPAIAAIGFDCRAGQDGELLINQDNPHNFEHQNLPGMRAGDLLPIAREG